MLLRGDPRSRDMSVLGCGYYGQYVTNEFSHVHESVIERHLIDYRDHRGNAYRGGGGGTIDDHVLPVPGTRWVYAKGGWV